MNFSELTKEELAFLKLVYGLKIHEDCFFLIVEAPGKRNYPFDEQKLDRRYLAGIVFTYPIPVQKAMWEYVIKNFILEKERLKWINELENWLQQLKLDDNIIKYKEKGGGFES